MFTMSNLKSICKPYYEYEDTFTGACVGFHFLDTDEVTVRDIPCTVDELNKLVSLCAKLVEGVELSGRPFDYCIAIYMDGLRRMWCELPKPKYR